MPYRARKGSHRIDIPKLYWENPKRPEWVDVKLARSWGDREKVRRASVTTAPDSFGGWTEQTDFPELHLSLLTTYILDWSLRLGEGDDARPMPRNEETIRAELDPDFVDWLVNAVAEYYQKRVPSEDEAKNSNAAPTEP